MDEAQGFQAFCPGLTQRACDVVGGTSCESGCYVAGKRSGEKDLRAKVRGKCDNFGADEPTYSKIELLSSEEIAKSNLGRSK